MTKRRSLSRDATSIRWQAAIAGTTVAALVGCAAIQGLDRFENVDYELDASSVENPTPEASANRDVITSLPPNDDGSFPVPVSDGSIPIVDSGSDACSNPTLRNCNGTASDGCETNTGTDLLNCGACGNICALGETCVSSACTNVFTTGLLGYWPLDDAAMSTVAKDSSPNNLGGKVVGTVTFVPGQGKQGRGAASFTGSGRINVLFPNNALGQGAGVFIPQGNITFAMWMKTSNATVQGLQVITGSTWGSGCDRVIGSSLTGPLNYNAWQEENLTGARNVNDGAWHHVVYVMDKTNGLFAYVDGASDVTDVNPTTNCGTGCSGFNWASDYNIGTADGCRYSAGDFTGLIDDVRIYDHVLTAAQVAALFNATK